jgi:hypothetical protein
VLSYSRSARMSGALSEAVDVSLPSERDSWHCEVQAKLCLTIVVLGEQAKGDSTMLCSSRPSASNHQRSGVLYDRRHG